MSKTYILEPTEFTFSSIDGYLLYEGAINSYTAENTKINIGSETYMYAFTNNQQNYDHDFNEQSFDAIYVYTKDGTYDGIDIDEPTTYPDGLIIVYISENGGIDAYSSTLYDESGATYTVSIYKESSEPSNTNLSKNVQYNFHAHNDLDRIRFGINNESGGGGDSGIFNVNVERDADSTRLNKTWQEIYDAIAAGKFVVIVDTEKDLIIGEDSFVISIVLAIYAYTVVTSDNGTSFVAATADDYPQTDGGK